MTQLQHNSGSEGHLTDEGQVLEDVGDLTVLVGEVDPVTGMIRNVEGMELGRVVQPGIVLDPQERPIGHVDKQGIVFAGSEAIGSVSGTNQVHGAAALLLLPPPSQGRMPLPDIRLWGGGAILLALWLLYRPYLPFWGIAMGLNTAAALLIAALTAQALSDRSMLLLRPQVRVTRSGVFPIGIEPEHRPEHLPLRFLLPICLLPGIAYLLCKFLYQLTHDAAAWPIPPSWLWLMAITSAGSTLFCTYLLEKVFDRLALARKRRPGQTRMVPRMLRPQLLLVLGGVGVAPLALAFGLLGFGPPSVVAAAHAARILPTPTPTPRPTPRPSPTPRPAPTVTAAPPRVLAPPLRHIGVTSSMGERNETTSPSRRGPTMGEAKEAQAVVERLYRAAEEGFSRKDADATLGYVAPGWKFTNSDGGSDHYRSTHAYFQKLFDSPTGNYTTSIRREIREIESFTGDQMVLRVSVAACKADGTTKFHTQRDTWQKIDGQWRCKREHRLD